MIGLLRAGELVLIVDSKRRRYLVTLLEGAEFHTHAGFVPHTDVIGQGEGVTVRSTRGARYTVVRPTLSDYILKMPRGAQVVYPKDLGPILLLADISPGVRVLEAGLGSGALSMALLRAGAVVTGYEMRADFAEKAQRNVAAFVGADIAAERYQVQVRDVYEGIDERELDRIVLDLPEPWRVVPLATEALHPGGILVAYTPSITQAAQLRAALDAAPFGFTETLEVLHRGWHIEGQAVRPDHRMVGHTGFLTATRYLGSAAAAGMPAPTDEERPGSGG